MQSGDSTRTKYGTFSRELDSDDSISISELTESHASQRSPEEKQTRRENRLRSTMKVVAKNVPAVGQIARAASDITSYVGHAVSVVGNGIAVLAGDYTKIPDLADAAYTPTIKSHKDEVYAPEAHLHPVIPHLMVAITESTESAEIRFLKLLDVILYTDDKESFAASSKDAKLKVLALIEEAQNIFSSGTRVELDEDAETIRRLMRSTQEVKVSENRNSFTAVLASSNLDEASPDKKIVKIASELAAILQKNEKNPLSKLPSYDEGQFCNSLQQLQTISENETDSIVANQKDAIVAILLSIAEASTKNKVSEKRESLLTACQNELDRWIMKFGEGEKKNKLLA